MQIINLPKGEIGQFNNNYFEHIFREAYNIIKFNQQRSFSTVITSFQNITTKNNCRFIKYDMTQQNSILQFLKGF